MTHCRSWQVFAICLLVFFGLMPQAQSATFIVSKAADTADGNCDSDCSLREAIIAANASPSADTITLPVGTYTLSIAGLDITASLTITGDSATNTIIDGGGVYRAFYITESSGFGITVEISGLTVQNGNANMGGGIYNNQSGLVTITDSSISNNSAGSGGGIFNSSIASMNLYRVTVSDNDATGPGGGGIFNLGSMTLSNTTVSGNVASSMLTNGGSGITNGSNGALTLLNVTIHNNTVYSNVTGGDGTIANSGTVNLKNSIVWANSGVVCFGAGTYNSSGHNLAAGDCSLTGIGDISLNPLLTSLGDNGGSTFTHALLSGSPSIDAGDNSECPATDQRGVTRPQDGDGDGSIICDIGAYEFEFPLADLTVTKTGSPDPVIVWNNLTFTLKVINNGPGDADDVTMTDNLPAGIKFVSSSASQGSCSGTNTITCSLGSLADGDSATATIVVTPVIAGNLSNFASVTSGISDPNTNNNSVATTTAAIFKGDINGDFTIDLTDSILGLQLTAGIIPPVPVYKETDVNGDGKIGVEEVIYVLQYEAGLRVLGELKWQKTKEEWEWDNDGTIDFTVTFTYESR